MKREKEQPILFKLLQEEQLSKEMISLKAEKQISKESTTLKISPVLDEESLSCAKGRKGKRQLDFNARHPILLQDIRLNYTSKMSATTNVTNSQSL